MDQLKWARLLEVGLNIEGLSMIGWLRDLSRPDANLAQIDN